MRNMTDAMQTAVTARLVQPAILVDLTFVSGTVHVWTGVGPITANGFTYKGIGNLGSVGAITEGIAVEAAGTVLKLSGVDPTLYADSMADIVTGQPASIWLACMSGNTVLGTILLFAGLIDQPTDEEDGEDIAITLALENNLTNLQRANRRLYTAAEQQRKWPNDTFFNFVPTLQDTANVWG